MLCCFAFGFGSCAHKPTSFQATRASTFADWEEFNVLFRELKSQLFKEGEPVRLCDLHNGAILQPSDLMGITIVNRRLHHFRAEHRCATNASSCGFLKPRTEGAPSQDPAGPKLGNGTLQEGRWVKVNDKEGGFKDMATGQYLMLNAQGAPAADAVSTLHTPCGGTMSECLQMKLGFACVNAAAVKTERAKSCDKGDCLLVLCTAKHEVKLDELPQMTGIVTSSEYVKYYGPYSGRAFLRSRFGTSNLAAL